MLRIAYEVGLQLGPSGLGRDELASKSLAQFGGMRDGAGGCLDLREVIGVVGKLQESDTLCKQPVGSGGLDTRFFNANKSCI